MGGDFDLRADTDRARPERPERSIAVLLALAAVVVAAALLAWFWSLRDAQEAPPQLARVEEPATHEPPAPAPPPARPEVRHPLEAEEAPLEASAIPEALSGLLGGKAAASFLQTDAFPRRFVATVDSLGREHSPPAIWPVLPTPGRFLVEERPEGPVIAAENAARYTPFVLLGGTVDVPAAVRLYRRMFPLLQQAYRELGFGERYLNDRVVEVIDSLLATPDAPESPRVELVEVKGPVPSLQPWVRYQFADPALEGLTAGQKILVRVGPVNQRRMKAKLAELRKELTAPAAPAQPVAATPSAGPSPADGAR